MMVDSGILAAGKDVPVAGAGRRRLRVLAPVRYPWRFNGPRHSRHDVENRLFVPFNRFAERLEGVTVFNMLPLRRFDLVHAFNRIPLGRTPFVIGFESHLPRAFGAESSGWFSRLSSMLAGPRCRAIIGISDHACDIFRRQHADGRYGEALLKRLTKRYPNIEIPDVGDGLTDPGAEPVRLVFVGNHFARKGGCVALRLAEAANAAGLPIEIDCVSSLEVGGAVWTDPVDRSFFSRYAALLKLPNVRLWQNLPNDEVLKLLRGAHFALLPTFGDTFGFSAIEAMANWVPVIGTRQGALPEFIEHGVNGILLELETNEIREWAALRLGRDTPAFESRFHAEVDRLAIQALEAIGERIGRPQTMRAMRLAARQRAIRQFSAADDDQYWDALYARCVEGGMP